ncbi:hypothetical protein ACIQBJ_03375 [Kitasatospora sp. NPDC088391]|uniref:hypothetical protein n=1 Tax=Kitasatospora sp. NPDC088391 TaxID=3364074 RepID=UPI00380A1253
MLATTYLDQDGNAVGVALVAPARHVSAARLAVQTFTAALRTRRILLPAPATACPSARSHLTAPGPRRSPDPVPENTPAAHREPCPAVGEARRTAALHLGQGESLLLVGSGSGAFGTLGALGALPPEAVVPGRPETLTVRSPEQAELVAPANPKRTSFVAVPCTPVQELREIVAVLRRRFPALRGQHPDQWCYRASDQRDAVESAARQSDLVMLLGAPGAALPPWLPAGRTVRVGRVGVLTPELLTDVSTLTVLEPVPGSPGSPTTARVLSLVGGLGPLSIVDRRSTSTVRPQTTRCLSGAPGADGTGSR